MKMEAQVPEILLDEVLELAAKIESDLQRFNPAPRLQDIWGQWPGDESIEELLAALTP